MKFVTYKNRAGETPFLGWLGALQDRMARNGIAARLARVEAGNFADCKPLRESVMELTAFVNCW